MRISRRLARPRTALVIVAVLAVLLGAWLWLRDSSLVAVKRVTIVGARGPDAPQIRAALRTAARNMTTLDVREDQLRTAVAPYAVVKGLAITTQFPHGLRITVAEQIPVAVVSAGGRQLPVAGDGTLLHDVASPGTLPTIPLSVPPGGSRLSDPTALHAVTLLAAAPYQLLARIGQVTSDGTHGLVASLRSGPSIYFGDSDQAGAKWVATVAVLADGGSAGASYLDVSDPSRPVAGAAAGSSAPASGGGARASSSRVIGG